MIVLINEIGTTFTRPHEVKIGNRTYQITSSTMDCDICLEENEDIFAKLPQEYDWYNYGKVSEYIHESSKIGYYTLILFRRNKMSATTTKETKTQTKEKSKKSWW